MDGGHTELGILISEGREAMRHAMELERLEDDSGGNYGAEVKSETDLSLIMRGLPAPERIRRLDYCHSPA